MDEPRYCPDHPDTEMIVRRLSWNGKIAWISCPACLSEHIERRDPPS